MTFIKICGIKDVETALLAAESGANYVGMIFKPDKRRYVPPERARIIVQSVHSHSSFTSVVGVFVNSPPKEVNAIAEMCQLDWVQLSGDESWEYCKEIEFPLIKAVYVAPDKTADDLINYIEQGLQLLSGNRFICLLDTMVKGSYGGTGQIFNWQLAKEVTKAHQVFIAGGLTPNNVSQLIEQAHPWGVDVSSGVETMGIKDKNKIIDFIQTVKLLDGST